MLTLEIHRNVGMFILEFHRKRRNLQWFSCRRKGAPTEGLSYRCTPTCMRSKRSAQSCHQTYAVHSIQDTQGNVNNPKVSSVGYTGTRGYFWWAYPTLLLYQGVCGHVLQPKVALVRPQWGGCHLPNSVGLGTT